MKISYILIAVFVITLASLLVLTACTFSMSIDHIKEQESKENICH